MRFVKTSKAISKFAKPTLVTLYDPAGVEKSKFIKDRGFATCAEVEADMNKCTNHGWRWKAEDYRAD